MKSIKIYDILGIGIGPFNLGLAALLKPVQDVEAIFFDQAACFDWHPGMLFKDTTLQVPFLADLVTLADPTSEFSVLNYLKQTNRIYPFYIKENFFLLRKEYNLYCKWALSRLGNCLFSHRVESITYMDCDQVYEVSVRDLDSGTILQYYSRKLVLGTGTQPYIPKVISTEDKSHILHSSAYLLRKQEILKRKNVLVVGSGQSAAEIFNDLLVEVSSDFRLSWLTRSARFYPLEYSRLTLEMTSPEYVDYFHGLAPSSRKQLLASQHSLYKGINFDLINQIYDKMYEMTVGGQPLNVHLSTNCKLNAIRSDHSGEYILDFSHQEKREDFQCEADCIILCTGYKYKEPAFLNGIEDRVNRLDDHSFNVSRYYAIDKNECEIFVQNAELHTHGLVTPDLGMGAYRNACIIKQITGREVYKVEESIAFQAFEPYKEAYIYSSQHS